MLNKGVNHSGENQKAVIASPIVAKAVAWNEKKQCQIIVVFQMSTRLEFYWVFRARSPRSARRSWKIAGFYPRDFPFEQKPYRDFGSFVAYYARLHGLNVVTERMPHKRRLSRLLTKAEHESVYGNWQPQDPNRMKVDMCARQAKHARSRSLVW